MLLISGGSEDFNLTHIADVCADMGVLAFCLFVDDLNDRDVSWSLDTGALEIDGQAFSPEALFVRWNAFNTSQGENSLTSNDLSNWFDFIKGWALTNPKVKILNRFYEDHLSNKPFILQKARSLGLRIPETILSNCAMELTDSSRSYIYKPVAGGEYTKKVEGGERFSSPQFIQEALINPEVRLYRIGDAFFAFRVESDVLDYRIASINDVSIAPIPADAHLVDGLRKLTDFLNLDYAAADFKTCSKTGELVFLEVNSMPMIAGFDKFCDGALSYALIEYLLPQHVKTENRVSFLKAVA